MDRARANRIRTSFADFEPCGPALVARVMLRLAAEHPSLRAMFPDDDTGRLNTALFNSLKKIVKHLDAFARIEAPLMDLGARVAARGANARHHGIVRRALLATMRELAAHDWSDDIEREWEFALTAVSGIMLRGAALARDDADSRRRAA